MNMEHAPQQEHILEKELSVKELEAKIADKQSLVQQMEANLSSKERWFSLSPEELAAATGVFRKEARRLADLRKQLTEKLLHEEGRKKALEARFGDQSTATPDFTETVMVPDIAANEEDPFSRAVRVDTLNTSGGGLLNRIDRNNDNRKAA